MLSYGFGPEGPGRPGPEIPWRSETRMARLMNRGKARLVLAAVLSAGLLLTAAGCKHHGGTNTNSTVYISNDCGTTVRIYFDGDLKATTDDGDNATLTSVAEGTHLFEVKLATADTVILTKTLDIEPDSTITVKIYGPSTIRVTNHYTEVLHIYDDNENFIGDIGVNVSLIMPNITFGSHTYIATRMSDGEQVATATIVVTDVAEYPWVINP